jgi:hypothetical protein
MCHDAVGEAGTTLRRTCLELHSNRGLESGGGRHETVESLALVFGRRIAKLLASSPYAQPGLGLAFKTNPQWESAN